MKYKYVNNVFQRAIENNSQTYPHPQQKGTKEGILYKGKN